jgi:nicotinamide-nucleotide amidase
MYEFCTNYEKMFENIVASAYTYVAASKTKALIIGMSGGIDSTLTAALAYEVAKRLKDRIQVIGRVIDIESKKNEIDRGAEAAQLFCHDSDLVKLDGMYHLLAEDIVGKDRFKLDRFTNRVRLGNIKARLRMIKLYDTARDHDGMVLSTDNYTEFLLGFWTLHGDVGDFGMIQNLWKTEVYGLAGYLSGQFNRLGMFGQADILRDCINAVPTDGLGITNSDFDQLCPEASEMGSPVDVYRYIDTLLYDYVIERKSAENDVVFRHRATKFKRQNPFNIPREYIIK